MGNDWLGGVKVEILKAILTVIFVIDCIVLTVIVLMQEGKVVAYVSR